MLVAKYDAWQQTVLEYLHCPSKRLEYQSGAQPPRTELSVANYLYMASGTENQYEGEGD